MAVGAHAPQTVETRDWGTSAAILFEEETVDAAALLTIFTSHDGVI